MVRTKSSPLTFTRRDAERVNNDRLVAIESRIEDILIMVDNVLDLIADVEQ